VVWDGRDEKGAAMPAGVYFYRIDTARHHDMRKAMLLN